MGFWDLLIVIPLGLLAGGLSGLLGIGGGLIFAPLLLGMGLSPHQALATSTLAIVPTALSGTLIHLRSREIPADSGASIGISAFITALLFSRLGHFVQGWQLLALQTLLYVLLVFTVSAEPPASAVGLIRRPPLKGLALVGGVAGLAGALLGLGGGLLMVPLIVRGLGLPIHLAIRFSTLAVACSASAASLQFVSEGRGLWSVGLLLGGLAAMSAQWTAARIDRVGGQRLAWMLRMILLILVFETGRRALSLALGW